MQHEGDARRPQRGNRPAASLAVATLLVLVAALFLWDLARHDSGAARSATGGATLRDVVEHPTNYVNQFVRVEGVSSGGSNLAAGAAILTDGDGRELLVIAKDARDLPDVTEGDSLLVSGTVGILRPDAAGDRNASLQEGPLLRRFENRPFISATTIQRNE